MKNKIFLLAMAVLLLSGNSSCILAAAKTSDLHATSQKIATLSNKTKNLEKELTAVKLELAALKHESAQAPVEKKLSAADEPQLEKLLTATRYAHGIAVVASPFIGIRSQYDTSDLIVNLPSLNTDLRLLEQRQAFENFASTHKELKPSAPFIDLSGSVEAQGLYNSYDYLNGNKSKNDIDLTRAELDVVGEINPLTTAAIIINYDNTQSPITAVSAPGARVNNSRVRVDRAFLTFGNLNRAPVYFTLGQIYVPFGRYSSVVVTDPLTKILGQTKERSAVLAFSKEGFYGSIYAFNGDSFEKDHNRNVINQGDINLGYKTSVLQNMSTEIGAGYILNIADSQGLQNNVFGLSPFMPFVTLESIHHKVPAVDAYFTLDIIPANISLMGEYITATKRFDPLDLSYNYKGAQPSALDLEGVYRFNIGGKKCNFGIGYDQSWQAFGMGFPYGIPKQSYFAVFSTSLLKYTIQSLEFRHNTAYSHSDAASFKGANFEEIRLPSCVSRSQNIVTLQIGAYF